MSSVYFVCLYFYVRIINKGNRNEQIFLARKNADVFKEKNEV